MNHPDAIRWNERYLLEGKQRLNRPPNHLVRQVGSWAPVPGLALDIACGLGNNGRFLAGLGWTIIGLDISLVALRLAHKEARRHSLAFYPAVFDLSKLWLPAAHFDLIVNIRFLDRGIFPLYNRALKAGGILIFETFLNQQQSQEKREHYLDPGELRQSFADYQILSWGTRQDGERFLEFLVARKPED
jgi:SAM-dependent methyltransferase